MTLRFGDKTVNNNNLLDYVSRKKGSQTSSLSVTNRLRLNTWLFLFNKLNVVLEILQPAQQ